ncbi:hypothetical protein SK128_020410 [Halocaridina rubra]|uniref:histone acetyltransferase n=1 Tax=Halocaridina rubra TaxID=373956 RepID=A0AAN8WNT5_HALRR
MPSGFDLERMVNQLVGGQDTGQSAGENSDGVFQTNQSRRNGQVSRQVPQGRNPRQNTSQTARRLAHILRPPFGQFVRTSNPQQIVVYPAGHFMQGNRAPPFVRAPAGPFIQPNYSNEAWIPTQQYLVSILNAYKCLISSMQSRTECPNSHCQVMQGVLLHINNCRFGPICPYQHCIFSKHLFAHWRYCSSIHCPICVPVRHIFYKEPPGGQGGPPSGSPGGNDDGGPDGMPPPVVI